MDRPRTFLPMALAKLVTDQDASDLGVELLALLERGQHRVTFGLGPGVDVPLLDEELYAAEVAVVDRELVVATVRAEPDGYVVERGWSNFGVYVWSEREPIWSSVPHVGAVRGLRPGDKVALGSTPAEAVRFRLPECSLVPPPVAHRTRRQSRALDQRVARTPGPAPPRATPAPVSSRAARPASTPRPAEATAPHRSPDDRMRFQPAFSAALNHWQYAMVTLGADPGSVIVLDDPEIGGVRAALARNLDQPERGYDLFVKDPGHDLWVQPHGDGPRNLAKGAVVRLKGPGNRIGFWGYVVELPEPKRPTPRFAARETPSSADIIFVLGLDPARVDDAEHVKGRYRDLVRRFHPDRNPGNPGHLSRFLEIQASFATWEQRRRSG